LIEEFFNVCFNRKKPILGGSLHKPGIFSFGFGGDSRMVRFDGLTKQGVVHSWTKSGDVNRIFVSLRVVLENASSESVKSDVGVT
jgi:hypothetical protein